MLRSVAYVVVVLGLVSIWILRFLLSIVRAKRFVRACTCLLSVRALSLYLLSGAWLHDTTTTCMLLIQSTRCEACLSLNDTVVVVNPLVIAK